MAVTKTFFLKNKIKHSIQREEVSRKNWLRVQRIHQDDNEVHWTRDGS